MEDFDICCSGIFGQSCRMVDKTNLSWLLAVRLDTRSLFGLFLGFPTKPLAPLGGSTASRDVSIDSITSSVPTVKHSIIILLSKLPSKARCPLRRIRGKGFHWLVLSRLFFFFQPPFGKENSKSLIVLERVQTTN